MLRQRIIGSGGVEALIGLLLFAMSAYAGWVGLIPAVNVALDAAALAIVLVSLRWLPVGIAASLVVIAGVMVFDPNALGMALYLCMIPVISAVRQDRFPLALVATAINGVAGWMVSYRLTGDDADAVGPMLSWVILYGVAWVIGLGFRAAGRSAAERVATQFRQRQIAMASELHDSVARDLSVLAVQADAARLAGSATPAELELIAKHARNANRTVEEVTRLLRGGDRTTTPVATVGAALSAGRRELEHLGFTVKVTGQVEPEPPSTIAVAGGTILREALHNVARHGNPGTPCSVSFRRTPEMLGITVSNAPMGKDTGNRTGLGLGSMRHHGEAVGGCVDAGEVRGMWVCTIDLPVAVQELSTRQA